MKEHAASGERAPKTKDLCAKRTIVGAASREPSPSREKRSREKRLTSLQSRSTERLYYTVLTYLPTTSRYNTRRDLKERNYRLVFFEDKGK